MKARDQLVGLLLGERLQEHAGRVQLAASPVRSPVEQLRARHAQEQYRRPTREIRDMLDELEKDVLAPLDVVEQANQRLLRGLGLEQLAKRPRDLIGRCRRGDARPRRARPQAHGVRSRRRGARVRRACFTTSTTGQYVMPSP